MLTTNFRSVSSRNPKSGLENRNPKSMLEDSKHAIRKHTHTLKLRMTLNLTEVIPWFTKLVSSDFPICSCSLFHPVASL